MSTSLRVLLIEDDRGDALLVRHLLGDSPRTHVSVVERVAQGVAELRDGSCDVVLLDLNLPDAAGFDGLKRLLGVEPPVPVVVLTGLADEEVALSALEHGAQDYLVKGQFDHDLLRRTLRYAIERHRVQQELIERDETYQNLVDSIPEIVYSRSLDGAVLFIGARVDQISGVSREKMYRRESSWYELIHPLDRQRVEVEIRRAVGAGTEFRIEYRIIDMNARLRWFVDHGHGVRGQSGPAQRIDGILFEITERKHQEERYEIEVLETRDALAQLQRLIAPALDPTLASAVRSEEELVALEHRYATLLTGYTEARTGESTPDRNALRALAHRLADLGATPHDVVRMHLAAIGAIAAGDDDRLLALSRLMLLEIMGYLADQYRAAARGAAGRHRSG